MRTTMTLSRTAILGAAVLGLVACTSVTKEDLSSDNFDIESLSQTDAAVYNCDNKPLGALFHAEQAKVTWKGDTYSLKQQESESGTLYSGDGLSLSIQGEDAELMKAEGEAVSCELIRIDY